MLHHFRKRQKIDKLRTCIVCFAKNEDRTIQEWLNYHIKLGFDKIFLYQNDWNCNVECDFLIKLRMNGKNMQVPAYTHWLSSEYRNEFDWAAIIDCDEFIVLHKHKNISEFLFEFDTNDVVGVSANWVFFSHGGKESPYPNPESLLKRFTFRQNGSNSHVKTILNLKMKFFMNTPHSPNRPTIDTNRKKFFGPYNPNGPIDVIQINHYYFKSRQEWIEKVNRGQADNTVRKIKDWDNQTCNERDIEDLTALNFLYKTH